MKYSEQLQTSQWKIKRAGIIKRDKVCQRCGSKHRLEVHHKVYLKSKLAWEYPDYFLVTLCHDCHEQETISNAVFKSKLRQLMLDGTDSEELIRMIDEFTDIGKSSIADNDEYYDEIMNHIVWSNLPKLDDCLKRYGKTPNNVPR